MQVSITCVLIPYTRVIIIHWILLSFFLYGAWYRFTFFCSDDCYSTSIITRVYRPAKGGKMACNFHTSLYRGQMLAVTKFKSRNDAV